MWVGEGRRVVDCCAMHLRETSQGLHCVQLLVGHHKQCCMSGLGAGRPEWRVAGAGSLALNLIHTAPPCALQTPYITEPPPLQAGWKLQVRA